MQNEDLRQFNETHVLLSLLTMPSSVKVDKEPGVGVSSQLKAATDSPRLWKTCVKTIRGFWPPTRARRLMKPLSHDHPGNGLLTRTYSVIG